MAEPDFPQDDCDRLRAGLDIRPHSDGERSWWVVADVDRVRRGRSTGARVDHVVGVGSLLDVGTGNGAHGEKPEQLAAVAVPVVRELVRHGMLEPAR